MNESVHPTTSNDIECSVPDIAEQTEETTTDVVNEKASKTGSLDSGALRNGVKQASTVLIQVYITVFGV